MNIKKDLYSPVSVILITVIVSIFLLFIASLFNEFNSLFLGIIGSVLGTIIAIIFVFHINYELEYSKYRDYLNKEIISNYKNFLEFPEKVDEIFKLWQEGKADIWIGKRVTTRLEMNEVYHYLSDKAYFAFINKGFELKLSEDILQNLCPYYYYGKKFSEYEQQLEVRANNCIIPSGEYKDEKIMAALRGDFLRTYKASKEKIDIFYIGLCNTGFLQKNDNLQKKQDNIQIEKGSGFNVGTLFAVVIGIVEGALGGIWLTYFSPKYPAPVAYMATIAFFVILIVVFILYLRSVKNYASR